LAQDRGTDTSDTFSFKTGGTEIVQYNTNVTIPSMIISEETKYMREALTYYNIDMTSPPFMNDLP